jgi:hypothetical protein
VGLSGQTLLRVQRNGLKNNQYNIGIRVSKGHVRSSNLYVCVCVRERERERERVGLFFNISMPTFKFSIFFITSSYSEAGPFSYISMYLSELGRVGGTNPHDHVSYNYVNLSATNSHPYAS